MPEVIQMMCECGAAGRCGHFVPRDTWKSLDNWRSEDERDASDELFIVISEHTNGRKVVQRYGNYCVVYHPAPNASAGD